MARRKKIVAARLPGPDLPIAPKVIRIDPGGLAGIRGARRCHCDNGLSYVMKDGGANPLIPHCEWFCTNLAAEVGIPSIPCSVLELQPDSTGKRMYIFGSEWLDGQIPKTNPWWVEVKNGAIPLSKVAIVMSWIYAFDHFINNWDRHANNYFLQRLSNDIFMYSMDYSESWMIGGFPPPLLPFDITDQRHNTVKCQRWFTHFWGAAWIEPTEAAVAVAKIRSVSKAKVRKILSSQPKDWLPQSDKTAILAWWKSKDFNDRLDAIAAGISNGTVGYI